MTITDTTTTTTPRVVIPQYSKVRILWTWAAAAVPMGLLAWVVAPVLVHVFEGPTALARALLLSLTAGLAWQFVLVLVLVWREQGTLRWSVLREALWLRSPESPKDGRRGGRLWWVLVPMVLIFAAEEFMPVFPHPGSHDFGVFLEYPRRSRDAHGTASSGPCSSSSRWTLNTVLGEELLFRGLLLPRMRARSAGGLGRQRGPVRGAYHLHSRGRSRALYDTFAWPGASAGTTAQSSASSCTARRPCSSPWSQRC